MTSDSELQTAALAARLHATNMRNDINNAMTRIESMRLTRLALEAEGLASTLELLAQRPDLPKGETDGFITGQFPTH